MEVVVGGAARRSRDGIRVHSARDLRRSDVTVVDGIPVTTVARTIFDLSTTEPDRAIERLLDEAERLDLFDLLALRAQAARARGRSTVLARVLDDHSAGTTATQNDFEELMFALLRPSDLPRPRCQLPLGAYTADFAWPEERVIVETDGRRSHGTRRAFEHDRRRDNRLQIEGWIVLRFTWRRLTRDPAGALDELREALGRRATSAPSAARRPAGSSRR